MRIHDRKELYLQIDSMQWYSIHRGMRGQVIESLLDLELKCTQIIWVTFYHNLLALNVKKPQNSHEVVYMDEKLSPLELYHPGLPEIPIPTVWNFEICGHLIQKFISKHQSKEILLISLIFVELSSLKWPHIFNLQTVMVVVWVSAGLCLLLLLLGA